MNIALVAHDNKKVLMENLCVAYRHILNKHTIYATGTTGRHVEDTAGVKVNKFLEGQLGGGQQLESQIVCNYIDLVIYLREPVAKDEDNKHLLQIMTACDEHNVPLATNLATAEALLLGLDKGDLNWREAYK